MQNRPEKPLQLTSKGMKAFVAIVMYMSIIKLPSTTDYWNSALNVPRISELMSVNKFEEIKRYLHFSDNQTAKKDDKLYKIRSIVDKLRDRLKDNPLEENLAVDEQIIPFKGRSCLKQYNPKKPHKWGYKAFVLSGVSGFSYDFEIFTGKADHVR